MCVSTKPKRQILTGIWRGLGRSIEGEDTSVSWCRSARRHGRAEGGEDTSVSWWRSTRHPGRMAGKREFDERAAGKKKLTIQYVPP